MYLLSQVVYNFGHTSIHEHLESKVFKNIKFWGEISNINQMIY